MPLDRFDFSKGVTNPLHDDLETEFERALTKALSHPAADTEVILRTGSNISRSLGEGRIKKVKAYAARAFFRASRRAQIKSERETNNAGWPRDVEHLAGATHEGSADAIEARILLDELLVKVNPIDRKVLERRVDGWTHKEIGEQLGISEGDSWFRLNRVKKQLVRMMSGGR